MYPFDWSTMRNAHGFRYAIDTQQGFENVLVIDNVPIVDAGKKDKLIARLRSDFNKAGAPIDEDRMQMPWDDAAGTNKGCAISPRTVA